LYPRPLSLFHGQANPAVRNGNKSSSASYAFHAAVFTEKIARFDYIPGPGIRITVNAGQSFRDLNLFAVLEQFPNGIDRTEAPSLLSIRR
jgi:hypothetical protein